MILGPGLSELKLATQKYNKNKWIFSSVVNEEFLHWYFVGWGKWGGWKYIHVYIH